MNATCRVEQRQRAHHAAAVIEADPRVREVTVVEPGADPTDDWLLDAVVGPDADGVPTSLFADVGFELDLREVAPQGEYWIAHAAL